jgi:hypothetical protein
MKKLPAAAAFSLVELTLAIGLAAFCLITVFALVPIAVLTNRNSTSETAATNIMALTVASLRAGTTAAFDIGITIPTDPTTLPQFNPPDIVPCSGGHTSASSQTRYFDAQGQIYASFTFTANPPLLYRLIVTFVRNPIATATTGAMNVNVKVTWPAAIDPCVVTPNGSVETFAALDRN